jgi:hypothetical protein
VHVVLINISFYYSTWGKEEEDYQGGMINILAVLIFNSSYKIVECFLNM